MEYKVGKYDVAVIGAGHVQDLRLPLLLRGWVLSGSFCINLDSIALMACNPSIAVG